ncbi:MAG: hypothetical protein JWM34_3168 [Ilumatobacteraceae bacterium]|nr:hypothetical protein [Ilumatobacteraceae bacterium]
MARSTAAMSAASVPDAPAAPRPTVDEWGRDARLIGVLGPIAQLRWDVTIDGLEHLPTGGALVVVNSRRLALSGIAAAWALGNALDRPVRFTGRPDIVPFGPLMRRVGGLLARPDEVAGALRAGEIVVISAGPTIDAHGVGDVDAALVASTLRERVPMHVAAVTTSRFGRVGHIEVSTAVRVQRVRRGPLAEVELADHARSRLVDLLTGHVPTTVEARRTERSA